jgi:hypothetical protein
MNYWGKVENMVFGRTMWGVLGKLLGKWEIRGAMGVNTLEKSDKMEIELLVNFGDFWAFLGDFVQIGFSWKRAIVGLAMPRGGRRKDGDRRLEDRRICHRERRGHREIKWAVGSGMGFGIPQLILFHAVTCLWLSPSRIIPWSLFRFA